MIDSIIGSIVQWPSNNIPKGWALCDGRLLQISSNNALWSLLGTYFGGDGKTSFALPDLRGLAPLGTSTTTTIGNSGGVETVNLTRDNLAPHSHSFNVSTATGNSTTFGNVILAGVGTAPNTPTPPNVYGPSGASAALASTSIVNGGGGQPHSNMQPYLALNYIICLVGLYPSRP